MKLGEYISKSGKSAHDVARELSISIETLRNILYERAHVSSTLAKKIYEYTNHKVSIQDIILNRAGWERCPCCSQTLSDYSKIDKDMLDGARNLKKQLDESKKK